MIKVSIFYCENRVIEKVFGRLNYELKKKKSSFKVFNNSVGKHKYYTTK